AAGAGGSSTRTGLTPGRNEGFALATLLTALLWSRKPRPPGRRAGLEALPIITRGEFRSSAPKQIRERERWFPMFGHKGKPRRSGAKCTGLCGRRGIGSSATGQFRARGSVPSARTLVTGVLPTEQQIGRPARPYKKGTDENALYIAWK